MMALSGLSGLSGLAGHHGLTEVNLNADGKDNVQQWRLPCTGKGTECYFVLKGVLSALHCYFIN